MKVIQTAEEKVLVIFGLVLLMLSLEAFASTIEIIVPQQLEASSTKEVFIDVEIKVSNLCVHSIVHTVENSTGSQIFINIEADKISESFICAQVIATLDQRISLGLLKKGSYTIDINRGQSFLALDVL